MVPIRSIPVEPGSLTYPDFPWIIEHREDLLGVRERRRHAGPSLDQVRQRIQRYGDAITGRGVPATHFPWFHMHKQWLAEEFARAGRKKITFFRAKRLQKIFPALRAQEKNNFAREARETSQIWGLNFFYKF